MEAQVNTISDPAARVSALDWLGWCRTRLAVLDPLDGPITFPEDPEASAESLRPFLSESMKRRW